MWHPANLWLGFTSVCKAKKSQEFFLFCFWYIVYSLILLLI